MSEQTQDLVTKLDVIPDLSGLDSFDAAIERAIAKVNQLDAAIKRVNNLKPASPYAPASTASTPSVATTAAVATIAATGANLVSRTPLADTVRKEAQKVARAAVEGTGNGIAGLLPPPSRAGGLMLPPPGRQISGGGGGLMLPPPGGRGGNNWSSGRAGGLFDPSAGNQFTKYDTSMKSFSSEPLEAKKKPIAEGVEKATKNPFGVDNMLAGAGLTAGVIAAGNALADSLDAILSSVRAINQHRRKLPNRQVRGLLPQERRVQRLLMQRKSLRKFMRLRNCAASPGGFFNAAGLLRNQSYRIHTRPGIYHSIKWRGSEHACVLRDNNTTLVARNFRRRQDGYTVTNMLTSGSMARAERQNARLCRGWCRWCCPVAA